MVFPYDPRYSGHWEAEKRRKETRDSAGYPEECAFAGRVETRAFALRLQYNWWEVMARAVRCATCASHQYETLLRIPQGKPLVCVECRQEIDLPRDNSAIFSRAVAFVKDERK